MLARICQHYTPYTVNSAYRKLKKNLSGMYLDTQVQKIVSNRNVLPHESSFVDILYGHVLRGFALHAFLLRVCFIVFAVLSYCHVYAVLSFGVINEPR